MFGKLINYEVNNNEIVIEFEKKKAYLTVINDTIINFFAPILREERNSKAVEFINDSNSDFEVEILNGELQLTTDMLIIKVLDNFKVDIYKKNGELICADYRGERQGFVRRSGDFDLAVAEGHKLDNKSEYEVYVSKQMEDDIYFYGLGERTGYLNKKGYHYRNWNTDDPSPHGETFQQLYKSIPFLITINKEDAYGIFFDNHFESHFDMGKENKDYYYFAAVDGNLDYYFIYGPTVSKVVEGYTTLTGTTPLPQAWTLGYQQCRWSYSPKSRLLEVAKSFREKNIPCDTLYLDIDYMDEYRVFTWDDKKFNNHEELLKELKNLGFKVVTIIDPGVKVDKGYKIYDEGMEGGYFATDKDGIVYKNKVWPGDSVYPDFMNSNVREWWGKNQKIMIDSGVAGIWNDMNEPASFNGPLPDDVMFNEDGKAVQHKEIHNIYGHMMGKATYQGLKKETGKRPFVVTRACYAGTQKYSTVWTGDNVSTWEHLRMSLPMLMNLGLSGFTFCGTDVGGFGHDCTPELLSRWVQVGAFTPLFRNHAAMGTRDQEPWAFDKETEEINRKYIKLRYKLMPYLYDLMWQSEKCGSPVIRPLLFQYQNDKNTYEINDQFLFGDSIMVAPIVEKGATRRMVYLPKGNSWIDYWTGEEHNGEQYIIKKAELDVCPIFVKGGSVIPIYPEQNYIGEKSIEELTLNVYLDKNTKSIEYTHYLDDGESFNYKDGVYNSYKISILNEDKIYVNVEANENWEKNKYKDIKVIVNNGEGKEIVLS